MTPTDPKTTTPQGVLAAARDLGPAIAERAAEVEAARRVPGDLLDELVRAGCFGLLLPASHGGLGADLPTALRVFEALARSDASVGWTVMIGASAWIDLVGLPRTTFDDLFRAGTAGAGAGRSVIVAGVISPSGQISPVDGGYRATGRWAFASGCEHADLLWGDCVEGVVDGVPQLRGAVFAPDQVVIEDTWTATGLAGTGSHHFHVTELDVPAELTFRLGVDEPCLDEPIVHVPVPALVATAVASVAVGIAQGALDDIVDLASDKVPLLAAGPLASDPVFQHDLAMAETEVRAARTLLHDSAEDMWAAAVARKTPTLEDRARVRATSVWATERAVAAVSTAHRAGGGTAIYAESPLQRRLRDIHALRQHFIVRPDTLTTAGAIFAGQDVHVMVF